MSRLLPPATAACCALLVVACDMGPPAPAQLRMGNLVPDAPAIDFCLKAATDSAFTTPFVGGSGLSFPSLSNRVSLDAGTYSLRIVQAPATNCNTVLNGLGDVPAQFGEGGAFTVAAMGRLTGQGSPAVTLAPFLDDTTPPTTGVKLRYIHAAPGVDAVDIGVLTGNPLSPFAALVQNLTYGDVSNPSYVPYNNALPNAVLAAVSPPGSQSIIVTSGNNGVTIPAGTVSTLWLIGIPNVVGSSQLGFLLSADDTNSFSRYP
jgi:Domain of unknown function (DUF4397)